MAKSTIRFQCFPKTEPPPDFVPDIIAAFRKNEPRIATSRLEKGLTSDQVLAELREDLQVLGFEVERGKKDDEKIHRPVFFGEDGAPTLKFEVDAYHPEWRCGLEIEAGRAWMGNAVHKDLVLAMLMVQVDLLVLAVANSYKFKGGKMVSHDYKRTLALAEPLYAHSRLKLPYGLVVVGY